MDTAFLRDIGLDADQVSTADAERDERSADWGTPESEGTEPDAVVWPESTADVSAVLDAVREREIPVTPWAAGTSLEGNPVPVAGGIALDTTRMDAVVDYRPEDFQIDVQPGLFGDAVNEACAGDGLFFPPLPSSGEFSTIGGMIANDASGMQTVKYGEVGDWVLGCEVVLADGTVLETGSRAKKTSAGYNLTELLVGSEGTLGVVTEATLELTGLPDQIWGGRALFESRTSAAAAVADVVQSGVDVAKIELVDAASARMANAYLDSDLPDAPMVFLEFHRNHGVEREVAFCRSILESHDLVSMEVSEHDAEMDDLWEVRHEMANALEPYREELTALTPGDVTVPISEYATLIDHVKALAEEHDLLIPCFGHAGDGNVHYTVMVEADDPARRELGERVDDEIVHRALELGGTATGEHGIGRGKRDHLRSEYGEAGIETMERIKTALDPKGILNPGKIFPEE